MGAVGTWFTKAGRWILLVLAGLLAIAIPSVGLVIYRKRWKAAQEEAERERRNAAAARESAAIEAQTAARERTAAARAREEAARIRGERDQIRRASDAARAELSATKDPDALAEAWDRIFDGGG